MVFSSATFVLLFLPCVFLITRWLPLRMQNVVLTIASLIFYGWGEPVYIALMLLSAFVNYWLARFMPNRKLAVVAVIWNIGLLVVFKYAAFVVANVNALWQTRFTVPSIALPIGISFYTFQILSYVLDVQKGEIAPQKNFMHVLLYMTFFPQLVAGPIVLFKDVAQEIKERQATTEDIAAGISRFVIGLAKKLFIANSMAGLVDPLYGQNAFGTGTAWLLLAAYMLQIYFDFSAYSDMAIGMGRMFGFHFKENFNYPYLAVSMQDFWRRWHISLSRWFRDYLYIPLGGNRGTAWQTARNLSIVFLLTGLWHGAAWTFVVWGLVHGLFLLLERFVYNTRRWPRPLGHLYALVLSGATFVIFRADSLKQAALILKALILPTANTAANTLTLATHGTPFFWLLFILGIVFAMPHDLLAYALKKRPAFHYAGIAVLWFFCLMALATASYNPFIYFRF